MQDYGLITERVVSGVSLLLHPNEDLAYPEMPTVIKKSALNESIIFFAANTDDIHVYEGHRHLFVETQPDLTVLIDSFDFQTLNSRTYSDQSQ